MDQKVRGLLAYIFGWLGGLIVLVAFKDNTKETDKHACQAIVANVSCLVLVIAIQIILGIIGFILGLIAGASGSDAFMGLVTIICSLLGLIAWIPGVLDLIIRIMGAVKAYQEKEFNIPVITKLTEKVFKNKLA